MLHTKLFWFIKLCITILFSKHPKIYKNMYSLRPKIVVRIYIFRCPKIIVHYQKSQKQKQMIFKWDVQSRTKNRKMKVDNAFKANSINIVSPKRNNNFGTEGVSNVWSSNKKNFRREKRPSILKICSVVHIHPVFIPYLY